MLILKNDHFKLPDGRTYTLLTDTPTGNSVFIIDVLSSTALPVEKNYAELLQIANLMHDESRQQKFNHSTHFSSKARLAVQARNWKIIEPLTTNPLIYVQGDRWRLISERSSEMQCSPTTILLNLRRYWQGGQTQAALLGNYANCGRAGESEKGARGKPSEKPGSSNFRMMPIDFQNMRTIIENHYLKDERRTVKNTLDALYERFYTFRDGNGVLHVRPSSERPTRRQLEYFLKKNYSREHQLRKRKGDKNFERDHRQVVGTAMQNCLGVGHIYEADATIVDVTLVSLINRNDIVGRPTLYYIIDRASRLIVSWYLGFENPSWPAGLHAIMNIVQNKQERLESLGVPYDPEDWPADKIMPQQIFADRGETMSHEATKLCQASNTTVTNIPSLRPDWKPFVEGQFKLTHQSMRDTVEGYNPASNANKRRVKDYSLDACLTLPEMEAILVKHIITQNRTIQKNFPLSESQLRDRVEPSPINLWNHGVVSRVGQLARHTEDSLRLQLLPSETAYVDEKGIRVGGIYYLPEHVDRSTWFVDGRKSSFPVKITYDRRVVDRIYVHDESMPQACFTAVLSPRSRHFAGMSWSEAKHVQKIDEELHAGAEQSSAQQRMEFRSFSKNIVDEAAAKTKAAMAGQSKSSRRKHATESRAVELQSERQAVKDAQTAKSGASTPVATARPTVTPSGNVISFPGVNATAPLEQSESNTPSVQSKSRDAISAARNRMMNG
ncbi:MAG: hypothetical protein RR415_09070 [Ruthenibacterium sp.]